MAKVTKDMIIAEVVAINPGVVPILMNAGMHCVGCPSAQGETIEEASFVHGMDAEKLVEDINNFLASVE